MNNDFRHVIKTLRNILRNSESKIALKLNIFPNKFNNLRAVYVSQFLSVYYDMLFGVGAAACKQL